MNGHIPEQLDAYLEGLLDSGARAEFEHHIAHCGSCQEALEMARDARQCLNWLVPEEAPPVPGREFYGRVERAIERRMTRNWFDSLGAVLQPRLAYPLLFLGLLTAAWALSYEGREPDEGLAAVEYPSAEFSQMAFTMSDHDRSEDLVMMNLVEVPEQ